MFKFIKLFPLSLLTVALIWYFCFFTPPSDTGLEDIVGFDKVVHFGMYFFLGAVILWEEKRAAGKGFSPKMPRFVFAALLPILMSGFIEIIQENCTGGRRSGDIWDFSANSLGAITSFLVIPWVLKRFKI